MAKGHFLKSAPECLKMCQQSISHHNSVGNKMSLKIFLKCLFRGRFFQKGKTFKCWILVDFKIWPTVYYFRKIQILSHKYFWRYSVSNLQFFSGNLRSLSLIPAIAKYTYCQNYKLLSSLIEQLKFWLWVISAKPC